MDGMWLSAVPCISDARSCAMRRTRGTMTRKRVLGTASILLCDSLEEKAGRGGRNLKIINRLIVLCEKFIQFFAVDSL